jgi:serine/threonine protein kinase
VGRGMLAPGDILNSTYEIQEEIGSSLFSRVYIARNVRLPRRPLAIKVLSEDIADKPKAVMRFSLEADILSDLDHHNIVRIYDFCAPTASEGTLPFLVMEYIKGQTLDKHIGLARAEGHTSPLAPPEALDIIGQLAAALAAAHDKGIIHRDLKPQNVMIAPGIFGRQR